ncbi:MAG: type I restriction-modification system subunit M [Thermomicrobiales bacterium]
MAIKKTQLYSSLWKSCDELRGGMDASQYKDYILTLLFVKYVSDKYASDKYSLIDIPEGGSFSDIVALKGDKEIGDKINIIIGRLAKANELEGVITEADFNDEDKLGKGKEMQDRLSKLVTIFDQLDFRSSRAEGDDLLGDAYEYLMRHFATESGKSKGQFYTPAEVSRILAKVVGVGAATSREQTVYDPTCGSGSLLIKAADEAPVKLSVYGQEKDRATFALAKMNMILHGYETGEIYHGDTITSPEFKDHDQIKRFDFAVANPPFSTKSWSNGIDPVHDEWNRFDYGVPPTKNGDYAFLLHVITSLNSTGKAAVILPHGVLFRGNAEAVIRRNLLKRGLIKGIIGLPSNLFYGTGIPACIVVIDKEHADTRQGVFMIDASKGFVKDGNKNRLRAQDIHKIVDVFTHQIELNRFARMVPLAEIGNDANDFNLNIPRYIDSSEPEDLHDLEAHLRGGIPNRDIDGLDAYWQVMPSLREDLFAPADRPGYSCAKIEPQEIRPAIANHPEFRAFAGEVQTTLDDWKNAHRETLLGLTVGTVPKDVIQVLAEDLLARFVDAPLLDGYDIYQRLMNYWAETMQDDVYLIAAGGWIEAARPRMAMDDKERNISETPDLVVNKKKYKMDLLPPAIIASHFSGEDLAAIAALEAERDAATAAFDALVEEQGDEESLLSEAFTDKGTVTKASLSARLKQLTRGAEDKEERDLLLQCQTLLDADTTAKKAVKDAQMKLDAIVLTHYGKLTEGDIKTLAVEAKWFGSLQSAVDEEVQRVTEGLATRVKDLEQRYNQPLLSIEQAVDRLSAKVGEYLKEMGLVWS